MLIDQVRPIKTDSQPKQTILRHAGIQDLRTFMTRVEDAYMKAQPGQVLLVDVCRDITFMVPVTEAPPVSPSSKFTTGTPVEALN